MAGGETPGEKSERTSTLAGLSHAGNATEKSNRREGGEIPVRIGSVAMRAGLNRKLAAQWPTPPGLNFTADRNRGSCDPRLFKENPSGVRLSGSLNRYKPGSIRGLLRQFDPVIPFRSRLGRVGECLDATRSRSDVSADVRPGG